MVKSCTWNFPEQAQYLPYVCAHGVGKERQGKSPTCKNCEFYVDQTQKTLYVCPDCGWRLETAALRVRCGDCGSLNLERVLPDGRLIKADADENAPENEHLKHWPTKTAAQVRAEACQTALTVKEVREWIDPAPIADLLIEDLQERGLPATFDNAKKLWLAALEDLHQLISDVPDIRVTERLKLSFTKGPAKASEPSIHAKMLEDTEKRLKYLYSQPGEHKDWDIIKRAEQDVENLKRLVAHEAKTEGRRDYGHERGGPTD